MFICLSALIKKSRGISSRPLAKKLVIQESRLGWLTTEVWPKSVEIGIKPQTNKSTLKHRIYIGSVLVCLPQSKYQVLEQNFG